MNTDFDRIASITLQNHGAEIFDNVSTNNALLYMLKQRGNIKIVDGGRTFTHPLYYNQNTSFRSYARLDPIDTPIMDDATRAEYAIKIIAGSLVISTLDEAQNAGQKQKLLDLLGEVKTAAEISMSEVMGDQVFADGLAVNDFDGLQNLINTAPNAQTDVGHISGVTWGYWRNQVMAGSTAALFNTNVAGLIAWNTALNNATFGRQGPRCVITTKAVYALYEVGLTANIRYVTTELADAGFRHLAYTTMPVLYDDNCPAGQTYMVDTDNLWLQLLAKGNFQVTGFEASHNQLSKTALMYVFGNLTCGSRRTQSLLTGQV